MNSGFNGTKTMSDGSTRTYVDGLVTYVAYPAGTRPRDAILPKVINENEGRLIEEPSPTSTPYTPTSTPYTPTSTPYTPTTTPSPTSTMNSGFNGTKTMSDGSTRTYVDGLVTYVAYPVGTRPRDAILPKEINENEGRLIEEPSPTSTPYTPTTTPTTFPDDDDIEDDEVPSLPVRDTPRKSYSDPDPFYITYRVPIIILSVLLIIGLIFFYYKNKR